jgi:hypothetical protein
MTTHAPLRLAAALLAAGALACGSSTKPATMSVHLVDGPGDYQEVNLHVVRVEIRSDATGWVTLATPDVTVNLLGLTGGVVATLADGATLPAGTYGQLRLVLGAGNTVKLVDGTVHDLTVPSGQQSGVKLNVHFDVQPGTTRDVYVDFDAHRSVWLHDAGASGKYLLRPVVRAIDKLASGSISGTLRGAVAEGDPTPLPGVLVTAQAVDDLGVASIVRSVRTGTDGRYVLDLLPAGGSFHVVSQPVAGTATYLARASGPIAITEAAPVATYAATFSAAVDVGGVTGRISPAAGADDADLVLCRQALDAGGTPRSFIVRTVTPTSTAGAEGYLVDLLPAGGYSLSVERRTVEASGNEGVVTGGAVAATVTAGAPVTADLTVP